MAVGKIPPLDLMFFLTETAQSPKHVGAIQIFKIPSNAPKSYMRDLVSAMKAAPVESPFNYKPHFLRFSSRWKFKCHNRVTW
jgi:diacylglycerol O-acyltransferase